MVRVNSQERYFTREGDFRRRADGYIVNRFDEHLMVFPVNVNGDITASSLVSTVPLLLPPTIASTEMTNLIEIGVQLPHQDIALDPILFDANLPDTFSVNIDLSIVDSIGDSHLAKIYYIKLESTATNVNSWAMYLFVEGRPIDIIGGNVGSGGQLYGQLNFDEQGYWFITTPETIISGLLFFSNGSDPEQRITLDYNRSWTVADESSTTFGDYSLGTYFESHRLIYNDTPHLSRVDFTYWGDVWGRGSDSKISILGIIAFASFLNPQDLVNVLESTSLKEMAGVDSAVIGIPNSGALGKIESPSLKTTNPIYKEYPFKIAVNGEGYFITSQALDSDQLLVSKQSSYRANDEGFITNQSDEYLRGFYSTDGLSIPEIGNLAETQPLLIPTTRATLKPTSEIRMAFNLPVGAAGLDVSAFNPESSRTYNASFGINIIDSLSETHIAHVYFIKDSSASRQWAIYATVDDVPVNIAGGISSESGQLYGILNFNDDGEYQSTLPDPQNLTIEYTDGADSQTITLILSKSTEATGNFAIFEHSQNGYAAGNQLKNIDIDENGVITAHWDGFNSSIYGLLPIEKVDSTACLIAVANSQSSTVDTTCAFTLGVPGDVGFGTIDFTYDEFE